MARHVPISAPARATPLGSTAAENARRSVRRLAPALLCLIAAAVAPAAFAHDPSRSLLTLDAATAEIRGRLDLSLRDLEDAVGLDADGDFAITWREVELRRADVERYARERLAVEADGELCDLGATLSGVDEHGGSAYAVLDVRAACAAPPRRVGISADLLFDVDPAHRTLVEIGHGNDAAIAVLSTERPRVDVELTSLSPWSSLVRFVVEGVWHIWHGYDHLAFVLLLIVPVALGARGLAASRPPVTEWPPVAARPLGPRAAALEILRVVTSFTLAHSITLALATLGALSVPTHLTESAIAVSVLIAALSNLVPRAPRLGAKLAFCFGLVHGLGFASALGDLGTGGASRLVSLAGFNLGVEAGQLAVVALALPALLAARAIRGGSRALTVSCSVACAVLAVVWLAQRMQI